MTLIARTEDPKPDTHLHGRPVYFGEVHLDGVDSFFKSASWADTGMDLDDSDLGTLTDECADYLVTENCEKFGYYKK